MGLTPFLDTYQNAGVSLSAPMFMPPLPSPSPLLFCRRMCTAAVPRLGALTRKAGLHVKEALALTGGAAAVGEGDGGEQGFTATKMDSRFDVDTGTSAHFMTMERISFLRQACTVLSGVDGGTGEGGVP